MNADDIHFLSDKFCYRFINSLKKSCNDIIKSTQSAFDVDIRLLYGSLFLLVIEMM